MKIIDKLLEDKVKIIKEEIMRYYCPEDFGLKDPTKKFCHKYGCEKCWNREIEECKNN